MTWRVLIALAAASVFSCSSLRRDHERIAETLHGPIHDLCIPNRGPDNKEGGGLPCRSGPCLDNGVATRAAVELDASRTIAAVATSSDSATEAKLALVRSAAQSVIDAYVSACAVYDEPKQKVGVDDAHRCAEAKRSSNVAKALYDAIDALAAEMATRSGVKLTDVKHCPWPDVAPTAR
jgi:hypothetical protein